MTVGDDHSASDPAANTSDTDESNEPHLSEAPPADREAAVDALEDTFRFFHSHVDTTITDHTEDGQHPDRPKTARDYFTELRGWDNTTVDDLLLGWAPPEHTDQLIRYLHDQGHDREAILATGVVGESDDGGFYSTFQGRYVLPYYDADGKPVYAIARTTGSEGGGAKGYDGHPHDYQAGKYAKLRHSDDRVPFDEPIFGLDSLENNTHVVIAEGIADAITARELGYAVLSPVARQFKEDHYDPLINVLEAHDVARVTIVADADSSRNDSADEHDPESISDAVSTALSPIGAGLRGALNTAHVINQRTNVDVRVTLPPAPADLENDLDEFVNAWNGDLAALLRSAQPAAAFPEYDDVVSSQNQDYTTAHDEFNADEYEPTVTSAHEITTDIRDVFHALDELNAQRVAEQTIVREWLEGPSEHRTFAPIWAPAGYDGTANYVDEDKWVDTGTRSGYGGPAVMAAIDAGFVHDTECPDAVRDETWLKAVDHLRELGFEIPKYDPDSTPEPTASLSLKVLETLDRDDARRYAQKRGVEWPTTQQLREDIRNEVFDALRDSDATVIDAPTAAGKSYTIATESWTDRTDVTGNHPVIQFSETREARDQAVDDSEEADDIDYAVLRGRTEACDVAAGQYDPGSADEDDENHEEDDENHDVDESDLTVTLNGVAASSWFETMCEGRGIPFSVAHKYLDEHNDQEVDLPCCAEEGETCDAISQWNGLPRDEDGEPAVDVIHATHGFAHVPSLRNKTNVIFDERPEFTIDLSHDRIRRAVSAFLTEANAPVKTFEEFVAKILRGDPANEHAEHPRILDILYHQPDREWYIEADDAHTLAPALTRAIYWALSDKQDANGRYAATVPYEPPRLDAQASDNYGWNKTWVSVVLDADNTVRVVRNAPDMSAARSVIGLDAHPSMTLWQQNVRSDIHVTPVVSPEKRALWRRFERGLLTVGVGEATRPLTSGEYFDSDGTRAFFERLREKFGDRFRTAITAASVEDRTERLLTDIGVKNPKTMHYGEEKSRDDFGDEDIGAVNGCIDPGDDYVLDLLAEADLEATPETETDDDGEEYRKHGRGFEGPDAERAAELLASVREQHVAQAAGRYARNADDPDDRATVFIRTDAVPPGFLDLQVPGVKWLPTDRQQAIIRELQTRPAATTRELAAATDCSKEHVRSTLERLRDRDIVERREHAGDHGAHLYRALSGLGSGADVSIEPTPTTTNDDVCNSYTWSLAVSVPSLAVDIEATGADTAVTTAGRDVALIQTGLAEFDAGPPPE